LAWHQSHHPSPRQRYFGAQTPKKRTKVLLFFGLTKYFSVFCKKNVFGINNLYMSKKYLIFARLFVKLNIRYDMINKNYLFLLILVSVMCSCVNRRQLAYFQPINSSSAEEINKVATSQPEPRIKINDALIIMVSALDPEAALPYNLPDVTYQTPSSEYAPTTKNYQYYTVDANGDITFPVLGKLHVVGLSKSEVIDMIQDKLRNQIVDPIVTLRFLNAKVTVLGEVQRPGTYSLNNGGMTILEALGAAGDLTQYGSRKNVLITRENNGKVEFVRLDLTTDEVFKSPYFYLQQNDVVYIEPNQARTTSNQSIGLWLSMVGTISSATTVVVSILSATGNLK
jgi:polysaccharide export outer membrane protein